MRNHKIYLVLHNCSVRCSSPRRNILIFFANKIYNNGKELAIVPVSASWLANLRQCDVWCKVGIPNRVLNTKLSQLFSNLCVFKRAFLFIISMVVRFAYLISFNVVCTTKTEIGSNIQLSYMTCINIHFF